MPQPSDQDASAGAVSAVSLRGVRKLYGEVEAVAGIDLDVADGEFFTLLGPSGSGKTTTLRMIAGFELPTEGSVLFDGSDVTRLAPYERDVNTVFQDYALFPHMSVGDNVAYGLMVKRVKRAERRERAAEALAMVRLEGFEKRGRRSSRAASASGWRWPGRWSTGPRCCCWTSRWARST